MADTRLEQDLERFDFSGCHDIKERLYQQLINMHRMENTAVNDLWAGKKMGDEELEVLVRRYDVDRYERLLFHKGK